MPLHINVFLTPQLLPPATDLSKSIVLVIDVFRATTTIATALQNGAKEIYPYPTLAEAEAKARELRGRLGEQMVLLCGERGGIKPEDFDAGNSPREYTPELVNGKTLILSTTNGTQAIARAQAAPLVVAASFANVQAVVKFLMRYLILSEARAFDQTSALAETSPKQGNNEEVLNGIDTIHCICAGSNGDFSYEDTLCGGAIVEALAQELLEGEYSVSFSDAAAAARTLYRSVEHLAEALKHSQHAQYLASIGFAEDVTFSSQLNTTRIIPLRRADGAFIHWHNPLNL